MHTLKNEKTINMLVVELWNCALFCKETRFLEGVTYVTYDKQVNDPLIFPAGMKHQIFLCGLKVHYVKEILTFQMSSVDQYFPLVLLASSIVPQSYFTYSFSNRKV